MKLAKSLKFIDVFSISTGAMISSGIFILPGLAFKYAGPSVFISYFLAGLLALTGALSVAELSTAMPKAGGDYFFINRSLGPLIGTVSGLLSWFALSLKTAFAIIGIAEIASIFWGIPVFVSGSVVCGIFLFINIIGVKESGNFEVIIVMGLLAIMAIYTATGLNHVQIKNFEPFAKNGYHGILSTAGFVFVSYGGLLKIASISEEVVNPKKNIPLGMLLSLFVVMILYVLMLIVTVGVLPGQELIHSVTPIADAAKVFLSTPGFWLLTAASLLAFISTANAGILAASRYPYALSRDHLMPQKISYVLPRFKTPVFSIILTGIFIMLSMLLKLDLLVKAASSVVILTYILSHLSLIILRYSKIQNYKPSFLSPFFPYIQLISMIAFFMILFNMGWQAILISSLLFIFGVLFYRFYGQLGSKSHSALIHLVEKVANKKMYNAEIENELKSILFTRDEVVFDRFDQLIEKACAIDLKEHKSAEDFFHIIAPCIAEKIGMSESEIFELLTERENESSTAISNFIAIPHIIVPGSNLFEIFLIRCQKGVYFSEDRPSVKAVFVLTGSKDERNFHLQALSSIAQIVQQEDFEKKWMQSQNEESLRDLVLLTERKRWTDEV